MSDSFTAYEEEWSQIKDSVQSKIDRDVQQQRGEQRKATLRRVTMELEEADEIVDQMEMEAKGKAKLAIKVRQYKGEVKLFRSKVTSLSNISDRDLLLAQGPGATSSHSAYQMDVDDGDENYSPAAAQRTRLLNSTQTLQGSKGRLDNSERMAMESEQIGGGILESLRAQRGQLEGANEELGDAEGSIAKASGTLKKMIRTAARQKYMLIGFIFVLVILIVLILWNKFR